MTRPLLGLAAGATIVAALVGSFRSSVSPAGAAGTAACISKRLPPAAPAGQSVQWGHIKSLTRKGRRFELRFDPAWWLSGETARRAAARDGRDFANDYYIVDESRRLLTYLVPANARVTVLTGATCATAVPVSELAQIVKGKNPKRRRLYDRGNHLGYWIRVQIGTVRSLDQQYQP